MLEFLTGFDFNGFYSFVLDVLLLVFLLRTGRKLKDIKKKNSRLRTKGRRL